MSAAASKFSTYETKDNMYTGGSTGTFSIADTSPAGLRAVIIGISVANTLLTYEFKKFTIDGNYFLTGKFIIKLSAVAATFVVQGAWTTEVAAAFNIMKKAIGNVRSVITNAFS